MYSLHPLDVGFDLKLHDITVEVPDEYQTVAYLDKNGEKAKVTGLGKEVVKALKKAGYRAALVKAKKK